MPATSTTPTRSAIVTTLFNVQAPGIITNTLTLGASYQVTENVTASLAWMHGFRNSIEGPILQVPGSSVRLDAQADTLWAGVNVKFGGLEAEGARGDGDDRLARRPAARDRERSSHPDKAGLPERLRGQHAHRECRRRYDVPREREW